MKSKTPYLCPCGSNLYLIEDDYASWCKNLRCLTCLKDSGACLTITEAVEEFERIYKCKLTKKNMKLKEVCKIFDNINSEEYATDKKNRSY